MNEQTKPLTVEVGKQYKTSSGSRVKCIYHSDDTFMFVVLNGLMGVLYSDKSGKLLCGNVHGDIVSEWIDKPIVDWSLYAKWHIAVNMDDGGEWYAYEGSVPVRGGEFFWTWTGVRSPIPKSYAPTFTGDRKDSLVMRPT